MSCYDDDYDDNEDEQHDDLEDDDGGIRRSTSNPFSKPSSVRGAGLPQRPPLNADGSVPSPIRSGGGNTNNLLPNRPGSPPPGGGSPSGVQPYNRSPLNRNSPGEEKKDDENDRTAAVNRVLGSFSTKLGNEDEDEDEDNNGGRSISGSNPFGGGGARMGNDRPDVRRDQRPPNSNSPFGPRQNDSQDDKSGIGNLTRGLGGTPSRLGGDDKKDNRSSDMLGGLTNRIGGGGNDTKKDDRNAKPAGGGLGGLTNRFGGGDDKKEDKRDNKPAGGGIGGLTNRFGGGGDKDEKNAKPTGGIGGLTNRFGGGNDDKDDKKTAGGGLGGLTNRFGSGDKKDDKKDNKPANSSGGGALGGLTNRFGGGDKKEDKNSKPAGGGSGALGGLTNRFGGGDKKEDNKPAPGGGAFGNRPGDQRQSPLDQSQRQSPLDQTGRGQSPLGGTLSRGAKPETSSNTFGGANAGGANRPSPFGGGNATPAKPSGAKKSAPSLSERLKGLNPFGAKDEKPAPRSRTSKTPKVDQGGLSLDNKLDIIGVACLLGSLILLLSSLSPTKGALTEAVNHNLSYVFGWGAAFVLMVVFAIGGWLILRHFGDEAPVLSRTRLFGLVMLFVGVLVLAQFIDAFQYKVGSNQDYLKIIKTVFLANAYTNGRGGGWIGGEIYYQLLANFGEIGGFMVVLGWLLVSVMLTLSVSAADLAMILVSNGRNLSDVIQQRQKRAAAVRAEKQQALALATQQISVMKPAMEGVPAAMLSAALPAPSEEQRRSIPITTAGRTSSVPFRGQETMEAEAIPVAAAAAVPAAKAGGLLGGLGGLGSRVRGALPVGGGDKSASDKVVKDNAAEKAASLRGRLMGRSESVQLPATPTPAAASMSASAAAMMPPAPAPTLPNSPMPRMSPIPADAHAAQSAPAATMPPLPAEKPVESGTTRLGDLLRRSPAPSERLSPTPGERLSPTPTSPLSPTPTAAPASPVSPNGVQPFPRSPLPRPDIAAALNGSTTAEVAPAQPEAKPDWKSRLDTLRQNGDTPKYAEPERTASPTNGSKPADPPFAVAQPSSRLSPAAETPAPPIARSRLPRNWSTPDPAELLATGVDQAPDHEMLLKRAHIIEETLSSFGAPGRVVDVRTGPVVTQFGVEPDYVPGRGGKKNRVKVGAIAALDKDLQLALGAKAIRIEAPVPGKGYVGVEVPNAKAEVVHLRDVLESAEFKKIKSPLALALGQGVDGTPVAADLAAAPHLLIAGTTGSGKSVLVNAIIASLLLNNTPRTLRFVMVDPKRVELTQYNGIPHLVAPVVVELERIVSVLKWVTREMDERYRKFSNAAARNIEDFNKHLPATEEQMPYIVVIIDELADLMMLAPDDTERTITRIAALARATGIHLVIATQRPSVDVVTGLIKANFPARVAFAVAGNTDSRVILDQPGAERLLGRGDMLYMSGDTPAPVRLQGVWVSDNEIGEITRFWRSQMTEQDLIAAARPMGASIASDSTRSDGGGVIMKNTQQARPQSEAFWEDDDETGDDDDDALADGEDAMYEQAVDMVRRLNKASVSLLQRRLRIGYTRAARLIDTMEERGIVGPPVDGAKPREVLPVR